MGEREKKGERRRKKEKKRKEKVRRGMLSNRPSSGMADGGDEGWMNGRKGQASRCPEPQPTAAPYLAHTCHSSCPELKTTVRTNHQPAQSQGITPYSIGTVL